MLLTIRSVSVVESIRILTLVVGCIVRSIISLQAQLLASSRSDSEAGPTPRGRISESLSIVDSKDMLLSLFGAQAVLPPEILSEVMDSLRDISPREVAGPQIAPGSIPLVAPARLSTTVCAEVERQQAPNLTNEEALRMIDDSEGVAKAKILTAQFAADGAAHTARLRERYQAAGPEEKAEMEAANKAAVHKLRDNCVRKPHTPGRKLVPLKLNPTAS